MHASAHHGAASLERRRVTLPRERPHRVHASAHHGAPSSRRVSLPCAMGASRVHASAHHGAPSSRRVSLPCAMGASRAAGLRADAPLVLRALLLRALLLRALLLRALLPRALLLGPAVAARARVAQRATRAAGRLGSPDADAAEKYSRVTHPSIRACRGPGRRRRTQTSSRYAALAASC